MTFNKWGPDHDQASPVRCLLPFVTRMLPYLAITLIVAFSPHYNECSSVRIIAKPIVLYSSIFQDQAKKPVQKLFREALDTTYDHWLDIRQYVFHNRPGVEELYHYYSKVGWHIRLRYHKRVIVYCIPYDGFFVILLVLGEKAIAEAMDSSISDDMKEILQLATPHSEGRSCYIEVRDEQPIKDIKKLLAIKLFLKA